MTLALLRMLEGPLQAPDRTGGVHAGVLMGCSSLAVMANSILLQHNVPSTTREQHHAQQTELAPN